jgi:uncharacterized protein
LVRLRVEELVGVVNAARRAMSREGRDMIERSEELTGQPLAAGARFEFRCHPGLSCFTACCQNKRLTLLPYDVLRLRRALECTSERLLAEHAELEVDSSSGWPALRIRLRADGRCPFVTAEGCSVYDDRPTCCRIYPLARAVQLAEGGQVKAHYIVDAPGGRCLGFGAAVDSTVEAWTNGQGLDAYRAANDKVARLFLHPNRPRPLGLNPAGLHAVVMALYNLDVFRVRLSDPKFAAEAGWSEEDVSQALASDEALLEAGQRWLTSRLFPALPSIESATGG